MSRKESFTIIPFGNEGDINKVFLIAMMMMMMMVVSPRHQQIGKKKKYTR